MTVPNHRWSFSLRTLLVVMTLLALLLAVVCPVLREIDAGLAAMGKFYRDNAIEYIVDGGAPDPEVYRGGGTLTDAELDAAIAERERRAAAKVEQP
jgi:hypothetical protein